MNLFHQTQTDNKVTCYCLHWKVPVAEGGQSLHRPPHALGDGVEPGVLLVHLYEVLQAPKHHHANHDQRGQQEQVLHNGNVGGLWVIFSCLCKASFHIIAKLHY